VEAVGDLGGTDRLEEEAEGLLKVGASLLDGVALAGDVQFWTERGIAVSLPFDDRRNALRVLHGGLLFRLSSFTVLGAYPGYACGTLVLCDSASFLLATRPTAPARGCGLSASLSPWV